MTSESTNHSLLVLAAGLGTRYGGLKQMEPVGPSGETLMDYSVFDAKRAGFSRVVFLIREEMRSAFEEQVGSKYEGTMEVAYAYQDKFDLPAGFSFPEGRERPWGTGHAVWAAREALADGPFAVINADDYYGAETFSELISAFSPDSGAETPLTCAMIGFRLRETLSEHGAVSRGICVSENGFLQSVEEWTRIGSDPPVGIDASGEQRSLTGEEVTSMNVWAFSPRIFPLLEREFIDFLAKLGDPLTSEFYLPAAVDGWIRSGLARVVVRFASCCWMGVTYKEDRPRVMESIARLVGEGKYPSPLR